MLQGMASALRRSTWLRFVWVSSAFAVTCIALIKGEDRAVVVSDLTLCLLGIVLIFKLTYWVVTGVAATLALAVFVRAFGYDHAVPLGTWFSVPLVPGILWLQRHWALDAQAAKMLDSLGLPKQPWPRACAWFLGDAEHTPLLKQLFLRGEIEVETLVRISVLVKEGLTPPELELLEEERRKV
jgi:hypothetical protein